jgi:ribosomal protein L29
MKKTDKIAYQQNSLEELNKRLVELRIQLVENKAKHATGNIKDTSVFKKARYEIALISTIINQKQNEQKS